MAPEEKFDFAHLVSIMRRLLEPGGCPWDRQQSHRSLKPFLIEEAYEVIEKIDQDDFEGLREELGDLLLQIVFHAELARLADRFTIDEVTEQICRKLIHRHPHVFANQHWNTPEEVLRNWEELKQQEKPGKEKKSIFSGLPRHLPSLLAAQRVQDRAARVGFEWENLEQALTKVKEEFSELHSAVEEHNQEKAKSELGDLLFALVNLARFLRLDTEAVVHETVKKFTRRFAYLEETSARQGRPLKSMSLEEMDALWEEAKAKGL